MRSHDEIGAAYGTIKAVQASIDLLRSETSDGFEEIKNRLKTIETEITNMQTFVGLQQDQLDSINIQLSSLIGLFNKSDL